MVLSEEFQGVERGAVGCSAAVDKAHTVPVRVFFCIYKILDALPTECECDDGTPNLLLQVSNL